jgi:hypothetical protein
MYRYSYKELFDLLPERYRKPTTEKVYFAIFDDRAKMRQAIWEVEQSRDIDKAYGKTLDKFGENVGQFRLDEDDDLYRQLIKVRIIANLSLGNIPTINKVLSVLTKDVYLGLKEVWDKEEYRNEPSKIVIELGSSAKKFPFEIVEAIKSAGVRVLAEIEYKGNLHEIWAGGRRRVLKVKYEEYQPKDKNGELKDIFAGRLVSVIRREWAIIPEAEFVPKGLSGQLLVEGEYMKGVFR